MPGYSWNLDVKKPSHLLLSSPDGGVALIYIKNDFASRHSVDFDSLLHISIIAYSFARARLKIIEDGVGLAEESLDELFEVGFGLAAKCEGMIGTDAYICVVLGA